jgi:hypothetical protein
MNYEIFVENFFAIDQRSRLLRGTQLGAVVIFFSTKAVPTFIPTSNGEIG